MAERDRPNQTNDPLLQPESTEGFPGMWKYTTGTLAGSLAASLVASKMGLSGAEVTTGVRLLVGNANAIGQGLYTVVSEIRVWRKQPVNVDIKALRGHLTGMYVGFASSFVTTGLTNGIIEDAGKDVGKSIWGALPATLAGNSDTIGGPIGETISHKRKDKLRWIDSLRQMWKNPTQKGNILVTGAMTSGMIAARILGADFSDPAIAAVEGTVNEVSTIAVPAGFQAVSDIKKKRSK